MKIRNLVFVALFFVLSTTESTAQAPDPTPTPPVDVMYTGRLLGYFRVPSLQNFYQGKGCPAITANDSLAARKFLEYRQTNNSILVGMGDNFAPQLEARVFNDMPTRADGKYAAGNKELYYGTENGWEFYENASDQLLHKIDAGHGTIPTDNVGCFLRAARFAAIVPGRHDFYFGPERVRQLARFLASTSVENRYGPVQMLGANLVIKTLPLSGSSGAVEQPGIGTWPSDYDVLNLEEGQTIYPWFPKVKIKVNKVDVNGNEVRLCMSPGGPNQIPNFTDCTLLATLTSSDVGTTKVIPLPHLVAPHSNNAKGSHFSTLLPAKNYGLCVQQGSIVGCLRFSTYTPFFSYPHPVPKHSADSYTDPDPFVVVNDRVAIFGVVDPDLGKNVGILNFGWKHNQGDLTARVSVEDPEKALEQQLEYFDEVMGSFTGLKILLAQTTPQRARALALRFPQFQMVVTGADKGQATSELETSITWDRNRNSRAFVAVPAPYYDSKTQEGSVHFGKVTASELTADKWKLESLAEVHPIPIPTPEKNVATEFWNLVKALPGCLPAEHKTLPNGGATEQTFLKWLVLCSMRDHMNADVALIQTRDLFDQIPDVAKAATADDKLLGRAKKGQSPGELNPYIQQTLDGLVWKGDLVTLLFVPGSALQAALEQSDSYRSEERSSLSLGIDTGRKLETLGIRKEGDEYFVNDLPLDPNKIYTVATTDFIGAGDTGYPDLRKAALNPRSHPAAYTGKLVPISSLVCQKLFNRQDALKFCLGPIESRNYLDETTAEQVPPYKQPNFSTRLGDFFKAGWPAGSKNPGTVGEAIETTVHRREIWKFSLEKFTFGFKGLDKNLTDKEVGEKFEGIPVSGVTATKNETYDVAVNTRLSRSSHKREFFVSTGLEFERQSTGDTPSAFEISQAKNRLFGETGLVVWRTPGRSLPNFGLNFSLYAETQATLPFANFTLATDDKIKVNQNRSLMLLPRFGLRWQGRENSAEIGIQAGREINALSGYRFTSPGGVVECLAKDGPSFTKCITENSDPEEGGLITKDSEVSIIVNDRPRAGMYWKVVLSRPITSKIKYELEDTGDFFFVNFNQDTTVDTRYRIISKHRLSFMIWPSVSIGPALDLLLYQNKVNRDFLFQRQFGFETKISFDIFNRREKGVQLKHKP